MKNKDSILNLTLRLVIITLCAGLILGVVYTITKGPIEQQTLKKATELRQQVLADAQEFEEVDLASLGVDQEQFGNIKKVFKGLAGGEVVGYAFEVVTKGYSPDLKLTVGMKADGMISGVNISAHAETPGLGANATNPEFLQQFDGGKQFAVVKTQSESPEEGKQKVVALTGATITSRAVAEAVNLTGAFFDAYLAKGV